MSGNENSGTTFNVNAVPSCIDEPVKDILAPGAKEIGSFFGDLLSLITGKVHFFAEKRRIQQEHDLNLFKEGLKKELESKPTECLTEPRLQIVGPAMERAAYCLGEEEIREMFQRLIANSADSRYNQKVHPSFSAIIEQMSPLDAQNLKLFLKSRQFPICTYQVKTSKGGCRDYFRNCFLANSEMTEVQDLKLQATSIESLERQGLVEIRYTEWLNSESVYEPFKNNQLMADTEHFAEMLKVADEDSGENAIIEKGIVCLSSFGRSFTDVCFNS